jgi:hypothetical protein
LAARASLTVMQSDGGSKCGTQSFGPHLLPYPGAQPARHHTIQPPHGNLLRSHRPALLLGPVPLSIVFDEVATRMVGDAHLHQRQHIVSSRRRTAALAPPPGTHRASFVSSAGFAGRCQSGSHPQNSLTQRNSSGPPFGVSKASTCPSQRWTSASSRVSLTGQLQSALSPHVANMRSFGPEGATSCCMPKGHMRSSRRPKCWAG